MDGQPPAPHESVERCAAIAAALKKPFSAREKILEDAGVSEERWQEIFAEWMRTLPSDADAATRYRLAFKEATTALDSGGDPRAVAKDVQAPAPTAPAPTAPTPTPMAPAPTPVATAPPPMIAMPVPEQVRVERIDPLDVTTTPQVAREPVLPFATGTFAPSRTEEDVAAPDGVQHDAVGETAELQLGHLFLPTPFDKFRSPSPSMLDTTQDMPALHIPDDELPFEGNGDAPPPLARLDPHQQVGQTGFHEVVVIDDVLPFARDESDGSNASAAMPPPSPDNRMAYRFAAAPLTLAQLAAVFVELQEGSGEDTMAQYHLTEEIYRQLDAERRALPTHDARFVGAWDEACQVYRRWRKANPGG